MKFFAKQIFFALNTMFLLAMPVACFAQNSRTYRGDANILTLQLTPEEIQEIQDNAVPYVILSDEAIQLFMEFEGTPLEAKSSNLQIVIARIKQGYRTVQIQNRVAALNDIAFNYSYLIDPEKLDDVRKRISQIVSGLKVGTVSLNKTVNGLKITPNNRSNSEHIERTLFICTGKHKVRAVQYIGPSQDLIFQGNAEVVKDLIIDGNLQTQGMSTFNGDTTFNSDATFNDNVVFHADVTMSGGMLVICGAEVINGLFAVNGFSVFSGSSIFIDGTVTMETDVVVTGTHTLYVNEIDPTSNTGTTSFSGNVFMSESLTVSHDVTLMSNLHVLGCMVADGGTCVPSDSEAKMDIRSIDFHESLEKIMSLEPCTYKLSSNFTTKSLDEQSTQRGFVAQHVESVLPELIHTMPRSMLNGEVKDVKHLDYARLTVDLVGALQATYYQLEKAQQEIVEMQKQMSELKQLAQRK